MSSAFQQSAYTAYTLPPNHVHGGIGDLGINTYDSMGSFGQWLQNAGGGVDFERTLYLANRDREFNSQEALLNRQWNEYMAGNSYQLAVDDMREAGLNPYMAITNGGASYSSSSPASSRSSSYQSAGMNAGSMLVNILGRVVGGAFGIATTALNNERLENLAELRHANAYDMQSRRFENQRERDFLKHEFNKTYKHMDYNRATAPRESHVWHYDGNRKR